MSRSRAFAAASLGARLIVGASVAACAVALVGVAVFTPWRPVTTSPLTIDERPAAADVTLACAGGILVGGRTSADASVIDVAAAGETVAGAPAIAAGGAGPEVTTLITPDVRGELGALSYVEAPAGDAPAQLAAATSSTAEADDIRGLTAAGCTPPLSESWLVGGASTTGRSGFVQLSNPSAVAATVSLTAFTAAGASTADGETGTIVVVPPDAQRVVPLAGLAPNADNPVVRVTAQGAPVAATLQSSWIRTITPSGVDVQTPIALPSARQVIPGVVVSGDPAGELPDAVTTVVRVLAPAAAGDALVTVTTGADAAALAPISVPMEAGVPVDLELPRLPAGAYSITIEASVPVVAAARQATQAEPGGDYAWHAAAPAIAVPSLVAVPGGGAPTLHLVSAGAPATVTVTPPSGRAIELMLAAGGTATLALPGTGVYAIDAGGTVVHASVSLVAEGLNAAYPVWSSEAVGDAVRVYP